MVYRIRNNLVSSEFQVFSIEGTIIVGHSKTEHLASAYLALRQPSTTRYSLPMGPQIATLCLHNGSHGILYSGLCHPLIYDGSQTVPVEKGFTNT